MRTSQFCAEDYTSVTYVKVVSNSCISQAVIVIIIVVYLYKFEQWHISSANNRESLIRIKTHIWFCFGFQLTNSYINAFKR